MGKRSPQTPTKSLLNTAKMLYDLSKTASTANRQSPYLYGPFGSTLGKRSASGNKRRKFTVTPSGTKRRLRKQGGAIMSKSRGMLAKGSRKWGKRNQVKYNKKDSFSITVEAGKVQSGTNCVWVGHTTFLKSYMLRLAGQHILAKLLKANGTVDGTMHAEYLFPSPAAGQLINIDYFVDQTSAGQTFSYTIPVGGTSFKLFGEWFANQSRAWTDRADSRGFQLDTASWTTSAGGLLTTISLKNMKIKYFVKSSFKIQNRSKAAADLGQDTESTDVVDNVPVYGKSYHGKGTALLGKLRAFSPNNNINLLADSNLGVILGSETVPGRSEPPQGNEFYNVRRQGKIHLDPAEIKTNVLTSKFDFYLTTLVRECIRPGVIPTPTTGGNRDDLSTIGKFSVFAMEKMIDVGATEPISIAFEHNIDMYCSAYMVKSPLVVRQFEHINMT